VKLLEDPDCFWTPSTENVYVGVMPDAQPSTEPVKVSWPLLQAEFPLTARWAVTTADVTLMVAVLWHPLQSVAVTV
jgi:hypothetical protein